MEDASLQRMNKKVEELEKKLSKDDPNNPRKLTTDEWRKVTSAVIPPDETFAGVLLDPSKIFEYFWKPYLAFLGNSPNERRDITLMLCTIPNAIQDIPLIRSTDCITLFFFSPRF